MPLVMANFIEYGLMLKIALKIHLKINVYYFVMLFGKFIPE